MLHNFPCINRPEANRSVVRAFNTFTSEEIDWIRNYGDDLEKTDIKLYGSYSKEQVDAQGSHFPKNEDTLWIYEKMTKCIMELNDQTYRFDLTGIYENMYYNTYCGSHNHHFNWHYDSGSQTPAPRKLTFCLQLSDPSEYEGGTLEIRTVSDPIQGVNLKGALTGFPSFKAHRVTPVTKGIRRSLVVFVAGPNFR